MTFSIVGGKPCSVNFVVMLRDRETHSTHCSGVLVAPDVVLTAGHCCGDFCLRDIEAGKPGGKFARVSAWWRHPDYFSGPGKNCDIGLLFLESPIPYGLAAIPSNDYTAVGGVLSIAGYGTDGSSYGVLRCAQSRIDWKLPQASEFTTGLKATGAGACNGDSGGPAFVYPSSHASKSFGPVVVGLASRVNPEGCGKGTIYTSVFHFRDVILGRIRLRRVRRLV